jgi:hypothetical protein
LAVALGVLALGGTAASASAALRYAAPAGTANESCSLTVPCDIVTAVNGKSGNMPTAGDEVIVEPGSYYELGTASMPLATSLSPLVTETIRGVAGQPRPRIFSAATPGLSLNAGQATVARDLEVEYSGTEWGVYIEGTLDELVIRATSDSPGVAACVPVDATIIDSVCAATGEHAFGAWQITSAGGPDTIPSTIRNSDLYATGTDGVGLEVGAGNDATIPYTLSNVIVRGGSAGKDIVSFLEPGGVSASVTADHSDYATIEAKSGTTITAAGSGSNIKADPALVDPAGGDFHETSASPTIDAGVTSAANGSFDFEGQPRTAAGKTDIGADEFFATPAVSAGAAGAITTSAVTLAGSVTPGRAETTYMFEYGTTPALGSSTPAGTLTAGSLAQPVSATIAGLAPGTRYYWELVATNLAGSTSSPAQTFTTSPTPASTLPLVSPPSALLPRPSAPSLSALTISPKAFFSTGRHHKLGATIAYNDTQPASTTITVEQRQPGVRSAKRCVAPPRHGHGHPRRCTRLVKLGSFTHADAAGVNRVKFSGKLHGQVLKPGSYTLVLVARNREGLGSTALTGGFRVE